MHPGFAAVQRQFANHLKDPERNPAPSGIEDRRMSIYRDLFYNNIESFISTGFPVLRSLMTDVDWHRMIRDFFSRHHCKTPYFYEIVEEFLEYLQLQRDLKDDVPFILELAYYEWVELSLQIREDLIPKTGYNPEGDLLLCEPVISPLVEVLTFSYPVHRIQASFQPDAPSNLPVYLVVYRDREDEVRFLEINALTARLLQLLQQEGQMRSGQEVLECIASELNHSSPKSLLEHGVQLLQDLRDKSIVLGTRLSAVDVSE